MRRKLPQTPYLQPLLELCLPHLPRDFDEKIRFLEAFQEDLPRFLERHRLHSLLLRAIEASSNPQACRNILQTLCDYHNSIRKVGKTYFEILSEIIEKLPPGIRILLLKGGDLILRVYKDVGVRPLDDIDILVLPVDRKAVESALQEIGFSECGTKEEREHHRLLKRKAFSRFDKKLNAPFFVEVHWDLSWSLHHYETKQLWERSQSIPFGNESLSVMHPADNFLYIGLHWLNHWRDKDRLLWGCDLAWLIQKEMVPWVEVEERAKALGLAPALWAVVTRLQNFWPQAIKIPENLQLPHANYFRATILKFLKGSPYWLSFATWNDLHLSLHGALAGLKRIVKQKREE